MRPAPTEKTLKLGTRRSLLAWAQSGWVARRLEELHPGLRVELVGIETRGDRIQNVTLQELARSAESSGQPGLAKEFFVAELDDALRSGAVDLTVHSLKDLSLERPSEFVLAAIPRRENPRDVALFGPRALARLRLGKPLRIGTSSPRRLENLPEFLSQALPGPARVALEFVEIRGNVNTRLARVHEPEESPRYLDAVVLAFAGLIRLWADETAREQLRPLLQGVRWMVLPLRECPAAPGQGALAVECRASDSAIAALLEPLHDGPSARRVAAERALLREAGGGCHQRFGATALDLGTTPEDTKQILFIRGKLPSGAALDELRFERPPRPTHPTDTRAEPRSWDGALARPSARTSAHVSPVTKPRPGPLFVAHSRAAEPLGPQVFSQSRVWTSGVPSWFRLARQGVWVEGCAEGLGFELARPTLAEPVLGLEGPWTVLTHDGPETHHWPREFELIATYSLEGAEYSAEARADLAQATHVFWSSPSQFEKLGALAPPHAHHSCGPGRTEAHLRERGLRPAVFPSVTEWREWFALTQPKGGNQ
jgi:hydroxymethylbilane synthase